MTTLPATYILGCVPQTLIVSPFRKNSSDFSWIRRIFTLVFSTQPHSSIVVPPPITIIPITAVSHLMDVMLSIGEARR